MWHSLRRLQADAVGYSVESNKLDVASSRPDLRMRQYLAVPGWSSHALYQYVSYWTCSGLYLQVHGIRGCCVDLMSRTSLIW